MKRCIKNRVFAKDSSIVVCGSDHGKIYIFSMASPIPLQIVRQAGGVKGHNLQPPSLEYSRVSTPNILRHCKTPYVPPHHWWSHNPSPSLFLPWNSKCHLRFELKTNSKLSSVHQPSPDPKLKLRNELWVILHLSLSSYLLPLFGYQDYCIYHCSISHCWYLYIAKDPS